MSIDYLTGREIVTNITMNVTQYWQLRQEIISAQNDALLTGLIIGCIVGSIGVIAGIMYAKRMGASDGRV